MMFLYTKRTTFANGLSITEIQKWFMSQQQMFNRNVRKYNCRTTNRVKMTRLTTIEQLLAKPICMMTGEELTLLLQNTEKVTTKVPEKHYEYGIEGLAKVFKCSIPTANRIKKSGVIDAAITQVGRKIVVDVELALELAKKAGGFTAMKK